MTPDTKTMNPKPDKLLFITTLLGTFLCLLLLLGCEGAETNQPKDEPELVEPANEKPAEPQEPENTPIRLNGSILLSFEGTEYKPKLAPVAALSKERILQIREELDASIKDFIDNNLVRYRESMKQLKELKRQSDALREEFERTHSEQQKLLESYMSNDSEKSKGVAINPRVNFIKALTESSKENARLIHQEVNQAISEVNEVIRKYESVRANSANAAQSANNISNQAEAIRTGYHKNLMELAFLRGDVTTKTNANAEFDLKIERGSDYVVAAYTNRSIDGDTQDYHWFVPYSAAHEESEDKIVLTNDNLTKRLPEQLSELYELESPVEIEPLAEELETMHLLLD